MTEVPADWAWEFAARTVLLDCGGLWALGDVLAETERDKINNYSFELFKQAVKIIILTSWHTYLH